MSDGSNIEWTEATWNPITGCSVLSPGCTNCYAMQLAGTRLAQHPSRAGLTRESGGRPKWTGEVRFNAQWLDQPLRWKRPRMIFVCAHGDLFHEAVPDEWIDRVFAAMALCPQHTFQVLTKRSMRMRRYLETIRDVPARRSRVYATGARMMAERNPKRREAPPEFPLPNAWLGVSVEDQQRADERIPDLLATPATIRWLSCEPLLGPIDLERVCLVPPVKGSPRAGIHINALQAHYVESGLPYIGPWDVSGPLPAHAPALALDWIVAGGESGPGARPMHPDWARSLRDQCAAAGVPFFFKQWGEYLLARERHLHGFPPSTFVDHLPMNGPYLRVGKKRAGRLLDGVEHSALPTGADGAGV